MEEQRRIYQVFLDMDSHKAVVTENPCVYVRFHGRGDMPMVVMSEDDLLEELDKEAPLVRWLLHQLHTYDCRTQRLMAMIFDKTNVLSDVLRLPR